MDADEFELGWRIGKERGRVMMDGNQQDVTFFIITSDKDQLVVGALTVETRRDLSTNRPAGQPIWPPSPQRVFQQLSTDGVRPAVIRS